jgi:hypothetical protein
MEQKKENLSLQQMVTQGVKVNGQVISKVDGHKRQNYSAFDNVGGNVQKKNQAMYDAFQGRVLSGIDKDGEPKFTALTQRDNAVQSTIKEVEGDGIKHIQQTRFRSGSIIEMHMHETMSKGKKEMVEGSTVHVNRAGEIMYQNARDKRDIKYP